MVTLFEAIDDNTRRGTAAFVQTLREAKFQVARNRSPAEIAISERLAAFLLAAQYESRLHWLINHPNSKLSAADISYVRRAGGTTRKWNALLRASLALRKNSQEGTSYQPDEIPRILSADERQKYWKMHSITRKHLDPLIDIRNSLAHGEWSVALTKQADGLNLARTSELNAITLYRIVITANLLEHLWRAHFDAQVTRVAFERDFDKHAVGMFNAARRLERGDEQRWLATMRRRYKGAGRVAHEPLTLPPPVRRPVANPKIGELLGTRQRPAERQRSRVRGLAGQAAGSRVTV